MDLWDDVLDVWKNFTPYLHRTLLTLEEMLVWTEKLNLFQNSTEKENIKYFIEYLEENLLLIPLAKAKRNSDFAQNIINERGIIRFIRNKDYYEEFDKYYHPFQFIQFLTYLKIYKESIIENALFNFFLRKKRIEMSNSKINKKKLLKKIEKDKNNKIKKEIKWRFKSYNRNLKKSSLSKQDKKKQFKKNKKDLKDALKYKKYYDLFLVKLKHDNWLRKEYLKLWIKLDSLYYFDNDIYCPNKRYIMYYEANCNADNHECREKRVSEFLKWREEELKNKQKFLSEGEVNILGDFITEIERRFFRHSKNFFDGLENWEDLIDIISEEKLEKITGFTSLKINILSIKRFLEKICWFLLEKNLNKWYPQFEKRKPHFIFAKKEESIDYRKSVLLDFYLYIASPFILYVDGETEVTIMREYLETKKYGFHYKIENLGGSGKASYHIKICKEAEDKEYFFFLDYDNKDDYERNKKIIDSKGVFFFPDFVTENFSIEDIYKFYLDWINIFGFSLSVDQKKEIKSRLIKSKEKSEELIQMTKKKGRPKGFEKTLINFTLKYFYQEILIKYPEFKNVDNHMDLKRFDQFFKTQFTENYLKKRISKSLIEDPDRKNEKFSFEVKIKPFLKQIAESFNRNINIKYDIKD